MWKRCVELSVELCGTEAIYYPANIDFDNRKTFFVKTLSNLFSVSANDFRIALASHTRVSIRNGSSEAPWPFYAFFQKIGYFITALNELEII